MKGIMTAETVNLRGYLTMFLLYHPIIFRINKIDPLSVPLQSKS